MKLDAAPSLQEALLDCLQDRLLQCPSCGVRAVPIGLVHQQIYHGNLLYNFLSVTCAVCGERSVFVCFKVQQPRYHAPPVWETVWTERVHPRGGRFQKKFPNTDQKYVKHYKAACETLEVSPEAAATMARRCLEELLHDQGYNDKNLVKKIEALLGESDPKKHLPLGLHKSVDHIRAFGNFGAHPLTDTNSLQIIDVEPGEAEWCITTLEGLFEHYFERPALVAANIAASNAKLQAAGKKKALS